MLSCWIKPDTFTEEMLEMAVKCIGVVETKKKTPVWPGPLLMTITSHFGKGFIPTHQIFLIVTELCKN